MLATRCAHPGTVGASCPPAPPRRSIRRDEVWTGWRREATERKQEARRKLRDVLRPYAWQEWTRRHIEVPCTTKPAPGRVVYPVGRAALSPFCRCATSSS